MWKMASIHFFYQHHNSMYWLRVSIPIWNVSIICSLTYYNSLVTLIYSTTNMIHQRKLFLIGWRTIWFPTGLAYKFMNFHLSIHSSHCCNHSSAWSNKTNYSWFGEKLFDFSQVGHITSSIAIWFFLYNISHF